MRRCERSVFVTMVLAVFLATAGWAQQNAKASPGGDIFKAKCILCHGSDGRGKTTLGQQLKAMDLHSPEVQKQSDADLKQIIGHGQGSMPPFQDSLSSDEIDQVLKYVRSEFGAKKSGKAK